MFDMMTIFELSRDRYEERVREELARHKCADRGDAPGVWRMFLRTVRCLAQAAKARLPHAMAPQTERERIVSRAH